MDSLLSVYVKVTERVRWQRGSISLEYILFIVAIAAVSAGVLAFYTNLGSWFENISLPAQPSF
jgi:hypothetical protein